MELNEVHSEVLRSFIKEYNLRKHYIDVTDNEIVIQLMGRHTGLIYVPFWYKGREVIVFKYS